MKEIDGLNRDSGGGSDEQKAGLMGKGRESDQGWTGPNERGGGSQHTFNPSITTPPPPPHPHSFQKQIDCMYFGEQTVAQF